MTAGDDTEHIDPILIRARQLLHRKMEYKTPQEVASKLAQSYAERLQAQIEATVLSRHRFTPNTFRDTGKKKLTASVFNSLVARIAQVKIKLSFLVCGFDRNRDGLLNANTCQVNNHAIKVLTRVTTTPPPPWYLESWA
jgi:hypothetical protein